MILDCYCNKEQWHAGGRMKFDASVVAAPRCLQKAISYAIRRFEKKNAIPSIFNDESTESFMS
jgi:hypothetical protein